MYARWGRYWVRPAGHPTCAPYPPPPPAQAARKEEEQRRELLRRLHLNRADLEEREKRAYFQVGGFVCKAATVAVCRAQAACFRRLHVRLGPGVEPAGACYALCWDALPSPSRG